MESRWRGKVCSQGQCCAYFLRDYCIFFVFFFRLSNFRVIHYGAITGQTGEILVYRPPSMDKAALVWALGYQQDSFWDSVWVAFGY